MTARTATAGAQRQVLRADMQPGCCKAGSVTSHATHAAGAAGKQRMQCRILRATLAVVQPRESDSVACSYRAQWGSRTSQQACLCTCTCTYVVLSCLPSMLSSECEGTHRIFRVSARNLQDWVLHRLFHGQGLRHARESIIE